MVKKIYYCETEAYDVIISADEETGDIRWTDDALLDEIDGELPVWINMFDMDRPTRAKIVFSFLQNCGDDDNWKLAEDYDLTLEQLLDGVKIIDETEIDF